MFDRKNGLAPGQFYQLVLSGVAMDEAVRNGEYVCLDPLEQLIFSISSWFYPTFSILSHV